MASRARVGVTQRVAHIASYGETRDCLDQQWMPLLEACGVTPVLIPNHLESPAEYCRELGLEGFVFSGGNDFSFDAYQDSPAVEGASPERDRTEKAILEFAAATQLPLLAVCRGLQLLHVAYGGRLAPLAGGPVKHVAVPHVIEILDAGWQAAGDAELHVNSFHNYGIPQAELADPLQPLAICRGDDTVEAARHKDLPFVGIMWHPERANEASTFDRWLISQVFGTKENEEI